MTNRSNISIITASRDASPTIRHCVQSIKKQTCPVEHIIIDGGSTDDTLAIAKKYARPDAIILSEWDNGLYDAINKGIKIASGDVIGTLNADDFYPHSKTLSIVQRVLDDPDVDACYGDLVYVDRQDISRVIRYWLSAPYDDKLMIRGWMPPHPTFFARRWVYETHGMYRSDMGTAADYEFLLRVLLVNGIRAKYIPTLLAVMRVGGASNVSLKARLGANRMDRKSWTVNHLQPKPWTILAKPIRKSAQYIFRKIPSKPWLDAEFLGKNGIEFQEQNETTRILTRRGRNSANPVINGHRPPVSFYVVTVAYNNENKVERMINSLRSVDLLKKLIIVDHSESDRISSFKVDFPTLVIRQPNKGYGAGLNRGLREIPDQNALVLLCNPDIMVPGSMQLVDALNYMVENPKIGCLIPSLVSEGAELQPAVRKFYTLASFFAVRNPWVARVFPKLIRNHHYLIKEDMQPFEVDWGSGSAMLVRNSLFPYPISFDERFFLYFEDVDVCAQMWRHGFSVVHYPRLTFFHEGARLSHRSHYYFAVHVSSLLKFLYKHKGLFHR